MEKTTETIAASATTPTAPVSRWQALHERWAMVREKLEAFFRARPILTDALTSLAMACILGALLVWALVAMFDGRSTSSAAVKPTEPTLITLTQCGQALWAYNEAQANAPVKAAAASRSAQPRARAAAPAAEPFEPIAEPRFDFDQPQPTPPPPVAPINREAIDQFRASLRSNNPSQE